MYKGDNNCHDFRESWQFIIHKNSFKKYIQSNLYIRDTCGKCLIYKAVSTMDSVIPRVALDCDRRNRRLYRDVAIIERLYREI